MSSVSSEEMLAAYWQIIQRLKDADIWHRTYVGRYDGISILANVPGAYWEIDVLDDGRVDIEVYSSKDGVLGGMEVLDRLIGEILEYNRRD